jgi:uncharacterized protein YecA (UPF0149 family)
MNFFKKLFAPPEDIEARCKGLNRNDPCWCGSDLKYKKCHMDEDILKLQASGGAACCSSKT